MRRTTLVSTAALIALFSMLVSSTLTVKAETYFSDDFNDPSSSNWLTIRGTWFESGGEYTTNAGNSISIVNGLNLTNYAVETSLRFTAPINFRVGIVFRYSSFLSYYSFEIGNQFNETAIVRYSPADPTYGDTGAFIRPSFGNSSLEIDTSKSYILRIEVQGTEFDAFVNGQKILSWNDSTYSRGSIGLRASSAGVAFDYIRVTSITPNPTATPNPTTSIVPTPTATSTATNPPTASPTYSSTPVPSSQPTQTPIASATPALTPPTSTFVPSLTESPTSSPEETLSPSPSIPEFPSAILMITVIAASAIVILLRRRINSKKTI